jgi:hypothetical protein
MGDVVAISAVDVQWMEYALYVVQVRTPDESDLLIKTMNRLRGLVEGEQIKQFALHFSKEEAKLLFWAANEGRCRTNEERLTKGRMQRLFLELSGEIVKH